jgi:basic membrane protein A and related proteins
MRSLTRRSTYLLVAGAMAIAATACGDDDDGGAAPQTTGAAPPQTSGAPQTTGAAAPQTSGAPQTFIEPTTEVAPTTGGPKPQSDLRVAYVTPDPIGQNQFLNLGQDGIDRVAEDYGVETETVESTNPTEREENVRAVARDGWDIVVVLGFEFLDIITQAADEFPDTDFVTVDFCLDQPKPNVYCAVFREHEAAFLVGAVAGLLTESNVIGTVTAIDTPFTRRWPEGFEQGAKYVNPDVDVKSLFVGSFTDPAKAKEQALAMSADGADHIFAAAASGNPGVFEAAAEENFFTYGVDINECPDDPEHIMENLIKRVDVAVYETVGGILEGTGENVHASGLAEGGVGLTVLTADDPESTQCAILDHPDVIEQVRDLQQKIIDGEIEVDDPLGS